MSANAATMSQIQRLLNDLQTTEGAPALSSEQVQALLEQVRSEAGLPPFPWTTERGDSRAS